MRGGLDAGCLQVVGVTGRSSGGNSVPVEDGEAGEQGVAVDVGEEARVESQVGQHAGCRAVERERAGRVPRHRVGRPPGAGCAIAVERLVEQRVGESCVVVVAQRRVGAHQVPRSVRTERDAVDSGLVGPGVQEFRQCGGDVAQSFGSAVEAERGAESGPGG